MRDLNNPLTIVSDNTDDYFRKFIETSTKGFYLELSKMIQDNDAKNFHSWFTERSYLSLFFNAVIRTDTENKKSVIQEYSVVSGENDERGRCDGLMSDGKKVVLFEAKAFSKEGKIRKDHFDVEPWVEWGNKIRAQLNWYYQQDKEFFQNKDRYENCYLATIVFKIIFEVPETFSREAETKLRTDLENSLFRQWYYSVAFLDDSVTEDQFYGIEVYGTVEKVSDKEFEEIISLV